MSLSVNPEGRVQPAPSNATAPAPAANRPAPTPTPAPAPADTFGAQAAAAPGVALGGDAPLAPTEAHFQKVMSDVAVVDKALAKQLTKQMADIQKQNPGRPFAENWDQFLSDIRKNDESRAIVLESQMRVLLEQGLPGSDGGQDPGIVTPGGDEGDGGEIDPSAPNEDAFQKILMDTSSLNRELADQLFNKMEQLRADNPADSFPELWQKFVDDVRKTDETRAIVLESQMRQALSGETPPGTKPQDVGTPRDATPADFRRLIAQTRKLDPKLANSLQGKMNMIRWKNPGAPFLEQWGQLVADLRKTDESRAIALEGQMKYISSHNPPGL